MPLQLDLPPVEGWTLVGAVLDEVSERLTITEVMTANPPPRRSAQPLAVHTLQLPDLLATGESDASVLGKARRTGWRYLAQNREQLMIVDLRVDGEIGKLKINQVKRGPSAEQLLAAARAAEAAAPRDGTAKARILTFPGLRLDFLWIADPGNDRFVTIRAPDRILGTAEVLAEARGAATIRLAPDDARGDIGG